MLEAHTAMMREWWQAPVAIGCRSRVKVPTRLWYGAGDEYIQLEHGRWYAERIAGSRLEEVEGAGHLVPVARWREIVALETG